MGEVLDSEPPRTDTIAPQIGKTVFELLAAPLEASGVDQRGGSWTFNRTIWATGYPPNQASDYDVEPDND